MGDVVRGSLKKAEPDDGDLAACPPPGTDAEPETVKVALMDLPDEVLVEIFKHLDDMVEVLRLRAVCRRWRDLLLHPDVWRHRDVCDVHHDERVRELPFVLRSRVPCLDKVSLASGHALGSLGALAASTSCAVKKLEFWTVSGNHDVGLAALVIRNQVALGRLREVAVDRLQPSYPLSPDYRVLLKALWEAEGLTTLDFEYEYEDNGEFGVASWSGTMEPLPCAVPPRMAKSSLTKFVCSAWLPDAVLEYFLECHAATLEDVDLEWLRPSCLLPVAALLSEAPRLRKLRCAMLPDMALLNKCPALETLTLVLEDPPKKQTLQDAKAFLRGTTRLETLRVRQYNWNLEVNAVVVDVLASLAASMSAAAKTVAFDFVARNEPGPPPLHFGLGAALFSIPHLHRLDVSQFGLSSAFFEAISPASTPGLRWLKVRPPPVDVCPHAWFHGAPLSDTLRRNPKLHLQYCGLPRRCEAHADSACEYCRWGCHEQEAVADAERRRYKTITVFAHPHEKGGPYCGEEHGNGPFWFELS